jgi:hypothetical protein
MVQRFQTCLRRTVSQNFRRHRRHDFLQHDASSNRHPPQAYEIKNEIAVRTDIARTAGFACQTLDV